MEILVSVPSKKRNQKKSIRKKLTSFRKNSTKMQQKEGCAKKFLSEILNILIPKCPGETTNIKDFEKSTNGEITEEAYELCCDIICYSYFEGPQIIDMCLSYALQKYSRILIEKIKDQISASPQPLFLYQRYRKEYFGFQGLLNGIIMYKNCATDYSPENYPKDVYLIDLMYRIWWNHIHLPFIKMCKNRRSISRYLKTCYLNETSYLGKLPKEIMTHNIFPLLSLDKEFTQRINKLTIDLCEEYKSYASRGFLCKEILDKELPVLPSL